MKTLISAASTLALVLLASLASAAEVPFDQAQFDSAKAAGQPVAVVFHSATSSRSTTTSKGATIPKRTSLALMASTIT
jgi:hypothetical protein